MKTACTDLPPDLPGVPLLGSALALRRDSLGFLRAAECQRGALAPFKVGPARWVLASRAEDVEAVLLDRERVFEKPDAIYGAGRLLFGNALTGLKGEAWRCRRAVVAPAFHRQGVDAPAIVAASERWSARHADGRLRRLDRALGELMVEVACTDMLGPDAVRAGRLAEPVRVALAAMGQRVQLGVPIPDWLPVAPVRRMRRGTGEVKAFMESAIARRRRAGTLGDDLLGALAHGGAGRRAPAGDASTDSLAFSASTGSLADADLRDELAVAAAVGGHQLSACAELDVAPARQPSTGRQPSPRRARRRARRSCPRARRPVRAALRRRRAGGEHAPLSALLPDRARGAARHDGRGHPHPAGTRSSSALGSPTASSATSPIRTRSGPSAGWTDSPAGCRVAPTFPPAAGGRLCVVESALRKQLLLTLAAIRAATTRHDRPRGGRSVPHPTTSLELRPGVGSLRPR